MSISKQHPSDFRRIGYTLEQLENDGFRFVSDGKNSYMVKGEGERKEVYVCKRWQDVSKRARIYVPVAEIPLHIGREELLIRRFMRGK